MTGTVEQICALCMLGAFAELLHAGDKYALPLRLVFAFRLAQILVQAAQKAF